MNISLYQLCNLCFRRGLFILSLIYDLSPTAKRIFRLILCGPLNAFIWYISSEILPCHYVCFGLLGYFSLWMESTQHFKLNWQCYCGKVCTVHRWFVWLKFRWCQTSLQRILQRAVREDDVGSSADQAVLQRPQLYGSRKSKGTSKVFCLS